VNNDAEGVDSTAASVAEETDLRPLPPLWRRVIDLFFSPGELFERLAANPKWLGALLLGAAVTALSVILIPAELFEDMMRAQFAESGQESPVDPAQMATWAKVGGSVLGPVSQVVFGLIVAGLTTLVFALVLGDRGKFRQYFAATMHAFLIPVIAGLAITPLRIASGDIQLILSPGNALRGMLPDGYLLDVLSSIDIFSVWMFALLAIAVGKIEPRRSFGSAFAIFMVLVIGFGMVRALFVS